MVRDGLSSLYKAFLVLDGVRGFIHPNLALVCRR